MEICIRYTVGNRESLLEKLSLFYACWRLTKFCYVYHHRRRRFCCDIWCSYACEYSRLLLLLLLLLLTKIHAVESFLRS